VTKKQKKILELIKNSLQIFGCETDLKSTNFVVKVTVNSAAWQSLEINLEIIHIGHICIHSIHSDHCNLTPINCNKLSVWVFKNKNSKFFYSKPLLLDSTCYWVALGICSTGQLKK
jgi:hypothetical protein